MRTSDSPFIKWSFWLAISKVLSAVCCTSNKWRIVFRQDCVNAAYLKDVRGFIHLFLSCLRLLALVLWQPWLTVGDKNLASDGLKVLHHVSWLVLWNVTEYSEILAHLCMYLGFAVKTACLSQPAIQGSHGVSWSGSENRQEFKIQIIFESLKPEAELCHLICFPIGNKICDLDSLYINSLVA